MQLCRFVFDTDLQGEERTPENYLKLNPVGKSYEETYRTFISEENFGEVTWN